MNGLKDLRIAGLGLAPAMTNELLTEPRSDGDLMSNAHASFSLRRLIDTFRGARGETVVRARTGRAAATPSSRPLARA